MASRPASNAYSTRALGPVDRRGGGEVVGEIGDPRPVAGVALERLADAQVQLGAPQPRHAVVERPAHELVGELEGELPRRDLLDHPVRDRLLQRRAGTADDRQIELVPGDGGELEDVDGRRVQAREALAHDLPHALGTAQVGERPVRPATLPARLGVDERPPQLGHEERVAAGQLAQRACDLALLGARIAVAGEIDELRDLLRAQTGEPHADHAFRAPQVGERGRQRLRDLRLGVAERREDEPVRVRCTAGEVAQEQQRRRNPPSGRPRRSRRAACACSRR